jgi:formate hydrogenlyase transcriptional activator
LLIDHDELVAERATLDDVRPTTYHLTTHHLPLTPPFSDRKMAGLTRSFNDMAETAALDTARLSRYDALLRVSKTLASHKTMAELFRVLADQLHLVVPFDYLTLILHDGPNERMRLVVVEPADIVVPPAVATQAVAERGPAATVWETQQAIVLPIPETGPLQPGLEFIRSQGRRISCWLPLTTAHRKLGVLSFGSRSADAYTDDLLAFMEQVAAAVAIAVDNGINFDDAQRYQRELREERDNLRFLLDINNLLVSHLDYAGLLEAVSGAVQRIIKHEHISLALYDESGRTLRLQWIYDKKRGATATDLALPPDRSAAGVTFQRGATQVFRRSALEEFGPDGAPMMKAAGIQSVCCIPLVTRNGKFGTLNVGSADADAFAEEDVTLLGQTSAQIAIAVENARAYQEMTRLNAQLVDEKQYLERELHREFADIVGKSPALRGLLKAVKTVAPTDSTVLLLGETGTGKELIARAIHEHSPRRERTFVRMSVAALPSSLFESELFGHEKGAFTGAIASRTGRFELAHKGTLFLDEVGDIPIEVQPKLLRALQEREFERLGSTRTQKADVRVVAATNRDLERMVEDGSFRSDLFYRLNVFPIRMPPLRERVEDIAVLAKYFAEKSARRLGRPVPSISDAQIQALKAWDWPGNIRELQNVIERAVIVSPGSSLEVPLQDLQPRARHDAPRSKPATYHDTERETILGALRASGGVIAGPSGAAARLGLRRTTLQSKMRRLGIQRPSF